MTTDPQDPSIAARTGRTRWFLSDRFGMFIHWGLYAIPARGEWVRSVERISNEDYQKYFEGFNPDRYDPRAWARLARQAGMKYAVLTAKHHDGFCLFDSRLTDYKSTNTPAGRDLVREYVEAFRAEGLKVGLYYSLLDWHHPDYPAYGDRHHPMRDNEAYKDRPRDFSRYLEYLHGQVRELLTDYGRIDIIWFDFSYDQMTGETWKATELVGMARLLQPHILIDNRLSGSGESNCKFGGRNAPAYAGDFACPEQMLPPEGLTDEAGRSVPWEACLTLNKNWGYASADRDFKSPQQVVRALVECVSKNGNLLLNVGPDARGEIPDECARIMSEVGEWMRRNGASITGCGRADLPKPEWGRYTQNEKLLYAHVYERGIGPVNLRGLNGKVKKARLLADGSEVRLDRPWMTTEYPEDAFIDFPSSRLPDELDTVVELELV
ncbi:MAG TPA: alpha-L-fucosidase [Anaerolineales bacterium]|nr:alpha-L-fucosidase [Anaerolineales bacterium]